VVVELQLAARLTVVSGLKLVGSAPLQALVRLKVRVLVRVFPQDLACSLRYAKAYWPEQWPKANKYLPWFGTSSQALPQSLR
jgi:hypothetical protein